MITIHKSFHFNNLVRWAWEFQEDSVLISMRSLTAENDWVVPYHSIKRIYHQRNVDFSNFDLAMKLVMIIALGMLLNNIWHFFNPVILMIAKILVVLAVLLWLTGTKKHEYCMFVNEWNSPHVTLKINSRNRTSVEKAIQLVKNKHAIPEYSHTEPVPTQEALFEIEEFNPFFYLTRRKILFFPNSILQYSRSLVHDSFTTLDYSLFNGKVAFARLGNNAWDYVWCYWFYLLMTIAAAVLLLFPRFLYQNWYFIGALGVASALLIPLYLAKFVKRQTWILLDKDGDQFLSVKMTPENRENLEKIGLFIENKVQQEAPEPA